MALLVDGVVQSVAADAAERGYWAAMVPQARPGSVLLLGLGAGTVALLLTRQFGPLPIVGVDDDPDVIALGRRVLGLELPHLEVELQDAFAYVASCPQRFDLICVDLYRGEQMARGVLAKPFLRQLRALLQPRGRVVFNLFATRRTPEQVHRLSQVLHVLTQITVEDNVVVHCRGRA